MAGLRIFLFGKFRAERDGRSIETITCGKVQELFSYLITFRNHPQPRESLSELLWENQPPCNSRKYLRQAIWKLQGALKTDQSPPGDATLLVEPGWIQINPHGDCWVDIAEFEQIYQRYSTKKTRDLSPAEYHSIRNAVALYTGDLLEGWYQNWCIFERERFRRMHLMLLDKLAKYCEVHQEYRTGLSYGAAILRQDRAFERAHRQMMRLYALSGDRTQALRQYDVCASALSEELGVAPSRPTVELYERIRSDSLDAPHSRARQEKAAAVSATSGMLQNSIHRLDAISKELDMFRLQVQKEIAVIKELLHQA
jgi:DNA-binding SARP family transcriptional activator